MRERIIQLMNELNLNSTRLADEIGVQRSSISHILSGRNKPSFSFIEKLLKNYPQINPRWLIIGEGHILYTENELTAPTQESSRKNLSSRESNISNNKSESVEIGKSGKTKKLIPESNQVKKIVIFYMDNSFEEYSPRDEK